MFDTDNFINESGGEPQFPSSSRFDSRDDFAVSRLERQTRLIVRDISSQNLGRASRISKTHYEIKPFLKSELTTESIRHILAQIETFFVHEKSGDAPYSRSRSAGLITEPVDLAPRHVAQIARLSDDQQRLMLSGGFSPSKELTEFWIRGVESYQNPNSSDFKIASRSITQEIKADFSKMLHDVISTYSQQIRFIANKKNSIVFENRFPPALQTYLVETFQIVPDESTSFLRILMAELIKAIRDGVEIGGAWGRLASAASGRLALDINAPFFAADNTFIKADDIE